MAILRGAFLTKSKNQLGDIITYQVNGRTIARSKPATYTDANTEVQQTNRSKFSNLVATARLMLGVISSSFQTKKRIESSYNAFMRYNNVPSNFNQSNEVFPSAGFYISKGNRLPVAVANAFVDTSINKTYAEWVDNSNGTTGLASDLVHVALYNATQKKFFYVGFALRETGSILSDVPADFCQHNDIITSFAYVTTAAGVTPMKYSDSSNFQYSAI